MTSPVSQAAPDWDLEQLEVILEATNVWQLVIAGPGAGKSAVACQRIAFLVDELVPPSRILMVSFTRTAVAELRDRIISYAVAGDSARAVRISTIDSHAWSLRMGFDDQPLKKSLGGGTYDLGIQSTVELFNRRNQELIDFMARLEHLIIDEAQDVVGDRADLVLEMLKSLSPTCGVTMLADPAQAIYGFTTDGDDSGSQRSLLDRLPAECPRPLVHRMLTNIHRVKNTALAELFLRTRKEIELAGNAHGHVDRVQSAIREASANDIGVTSYDNLAAFLTGARDRSMLVLFRRRADVLVASSYCSQAGVEHRVRMSGMPVLIRPWLGWLLGETVQTILSRQDFDALWESRATLAPEPFVGEERDASWSVLHRLAAGSRAMTLDLMHLRNIVSRARPPIDLCYPELGSAGPILSTIHASKGREADTVVLVMPPRKKVGDGLLNETEDAAVFEEGRVYYVGATRARNMLATAGSSSARVGYLDSGRIYRLCGEKKAQFEVGREGDIDKLAHLAWSDALQTQRTLAVHVGRTVPLRGWTAAEADYATRLILEHKGDDGIVRLINVGQFSKSFKNELGKLWGKIDPQGKLKPGESIPHLYMIAVTTVGFEEDEQSAVMAPFNRSALALAPVVKGFPMIHFLFRKKGRFLA